MSPHRFDAARVCADRDRGEWAAETSAVAAGLLAWAGYLLPALTDETTRVAMPPICWVGMTVHLVVFVAQMFVADRPPE